MRNWSGAEPVLVEMVAGKSVIEAGKDIRPLLSPG